VDISYDPAKRSATLAERGLDFADAARMFEGDTVTVLDLRRDYGEERFLTAGFLDGRMVMLVWTPRAGARRIISMRHAHGREQDRWLARFARPGG
jgi:uncharacterized DUF497 family protein